MTASPGLGPVEWIAIAFPGPALDPRIAPALATLVRSGTARLMDAVVVHRDVDGAVRIAEVADDGDDGFEEVDGDVLELLSDERALRAATGRREAGV